MVLSRKVSETIIVIRALDLRSDISSILQKHPQIKRFLYIYHYLPNGRSHYHIYLDFGEKKIPENEVEQWFLRSGFTHSTIFPPEYVDDIKSNSFRHFLKDSQNECFTSDFVSNFVIE